ncbi:MAG: hypothetical protein ACT4N2_01460 [Hyphomicrobium sp.]
MIDFKSTLVGALIVAAAVMGYVMYERSQRTISIELPSVKVD